MSIRLWQENKCYFFLNSLVLFFCLKIFTGTMPSIPPNVGKVWMNWIVDIWHITQHRQYLTKIVRLYTNHLDIQHNKSCSNLEGSHYRCRTVQHKTLSSVGKVCLFGRMDKWMSWGTSWKKGKETENHIKLMLNLRFITDSRSQIILHVVKYSIFSSTLKIFTLSLGEWVSAIR